MQRRKNFTRKSTINFKKKTAKKSHSQFRNIHPKKEIIAFGETRGSYLKARTLSKSAGL
ncbi:MAG TPA: hypothetical protein VD908_16610 [Cytophagales bacterium]|nr:hypothetical protein [Cytophagales bacterium]